MQMGVNSVVTGEQSEGNGRCRIIFKLPSPAPFETPGYLDATRAGRHFQVDSSPAGRNPLGWLCGRVFIGELDSFVSLGKRAGERTPGAPISQGSSAADCSVAAVPQRVVGSFHVPRRTPAYVGAKPQASPCPFEQKRTIGLFVIGTVVGRD